jgi:hypothetical protein
LDDDGLEDEEEEEDDAALRAAVNRVSLLELCVCWYA